MNALYENREFIKRLGVMEYSIVVKRGIYLFSCYLNFLSACRSKCTIVDSASLTNTLMQ